MDAAVEKKERRKRMFRMAARLAVILFIGLSLYLFISSIILLFLTKSDKEVTVPYVVGKRFEDVYNSLVRKGFVPEIKPYEVFDMDNGIILDQYPENGKIVFEGEKIKLVVSRSKVYLPVPNLVGSKLPFAVNKLKNINYNDRSYAVGTGVISYIPSDTIAESTVIEQNPEPGEEISPDRKVNLLVSSGKVEGEMKMPNLRTQSVDIGFDLLLSRGLGISEEIIITDSESKSGIIVSHNPGAGESIQAGMLVKLKVYYYPQREKPYAAYERVTYTVPSDEKEGIFEAYIDDSSSKRIRFSRKMKPGWKIDFIFKRKGKAKISITNNKKVIETIWIEPDFN
ncbi:MAG: PASTA domain-containing protein [Spirochaetes bacterium]|nr:PASTA domain-containing protein [Spirochaetota bacterium]